MSLKVFILPLLALLTVLILPPCAPAQEIAGPEARINDGHIVVSSSVKLTEAQVEAISKGIPKEVDIYVGLFRVWPSWPDEFVLGKKFTRTLSCDPVKKEFVATSLEDDVLREKRFTDCDSLMKWALGVKDLSLTSVKELDASNYFVKVTAESRLKKLPPVVGYFFFFVKQKEFKISADSAPFEVNGPGGEAGK